MIISPPQIVGGLFANDMKSDNKRIVRNTGLLYFRLIFLTLISLYTVRVTLEALGVEDYGIYNVVSSVVASLSVLTGAMTSATQRFLAFHLGRNEYEAYSKTFTLLLVAFVALTIALCGIGEGAGAYFIGGHRLNVDPARTGAVWWVFQTSLAAFAMGLITIPYTSSIIANERMDAFALFSIVEGGMKLGIVFFLVHYGGDRLVMYSVLTLLISVAVLLMSIAYCKVKFPYCRYVWEWDRSLFVRLSEYTGWNLFGSVSGILATQGQNILLNIYFGPVVNAAKAIGDRLRSVINGFSVNLYMAVSPQIIKSYSVGDMARAMMLVLKSSKMSFLLIFVMAFPIICNMEGLLKIWLKGDTVVPEMAAFGKLILAYCLLLALEPPISRLIQATGDIKKYQISVGLLTLSFIPIAALTLHLGASAVSTVVVLICLMSVAQVVRVVIAHGQVGLRYGDYVKEVVVPILKIGAVGVPVYLVMAENCAPDGLWQVAVYTIVTLVYSLFIAMMFGFDKSDRRMIKDLIEKKLKPNSK